MGSVQSSRFDWCATAFVLSLVIPSAGTVERYLGLAGVLAYGIAAPAALVYVHRRGFAAIVSAMTTRHAAVLAGATLVLLVAAFLVGYPIANSGLIGRGSDRDEALNTATTELLEGRYPYYPKTYTGNLITPLPGALIIAAPAVLLGNSAYQNLVWLAAFVATMAWFLRDARSAVVLLLVILGSSPIVASEYVTGGDLLANSLCVLLAVMWLVRLVPDPSVRGWHKALLAVAFGLGLAWRANFGLVVPLVFSALAQRAGLRPALGSMTIAGVTAGAVTLPFYVYDPGGFSPLHTARTFTQFESMFPGAGLVLTGACGLVAGLLAIGRSNAEVFPLLRRCALALLVPVVTVILLGSAQAGTLDLRAAMYGMSALFFGAVGFLPRRDHAGSNA